jgi:Rha family phage regulatory protein
MKQGQAVCNSRDVAEVFGKQRKHVLRDIDALISQAPACGSSFGLTSIEVSMPRGGTRSERSFSMTKDGFTLLAMGFTGPKALQFKIAYINRFNEMEAELRGAAGSNA